MADININQDAPETSALNLFLKENFDKLQEENPILIKAMEELADYLQDSASKQIIQDIKKLRGHKFD